LARPSNPDPPIILNSGEERLPLQATDAIYELLAALALLSEANSLREKFLRRHDQPSVRNDHWRLNKSLPIVSGDKRFE
jgi:hypothetical protein